MQQSPWIRFCAVGFALLVAVTTSPGPGAAARTSPSGLLSTLAPIAVAVDGDLAAVGAPWSDGYRGAVFVFRREAGQWREEQVLRPSGRGAHEHFGASVALRGDRLVVGASWEDGLRGAAHVYENTTGRWRELDRLTAPLSAPGARFGSSVSFDGEQVVVATRSREPRRFRSDGARWEEVEQAGARAGSSATASVPTEQVRRELTAMVLASAPAPSATTAASDTLDWVLASDGVFEDKVAISWQSAPRNDILYKVTRNGADGLKLLTYLSSDDRAYADLTALRGETYTYCVTIVDMLDVEGPPRCDDGYRTLYPPANVAASDGQFVDHVEVRWEDRSAFETGYVVRRDGAPLDTLPRNSRSFQDATAVPSTVYSYSILALDADGKLSAPVADAGFRGVIPPPLNVTASDGLHVDAVLIRWTDQATNETGYRIDRDGVTLFTTAADDSSYLDTTVAPFTSRHEYCVTTLGPGAIPSVSVCDSGGTYLPAPANFSATDSTFDDRVVLAWDDPAGLSGSYIITRPNPPGVTGPTLTDTLGATARSYTDRTGQPGVVYTYTIRGLARAGSGTSAIVNDPGSRGRVLAPTDVSATDGTYENRVEITWKSVSTTAVLFRVLRDGVFIKSVGGNARAYADATGTAGRSYLYAVQAVTAQNDRSAAVADSSGGSRRLHPPAFVAASDALFEDRVEISWRDTSSVENGFAVYRKLPADPAPTLIGDTGAGRTTFTDRTGVPGLTYRYSVAAYDTAGEARGESATGSDDGRRVLIGPTAVRADDGVSETQIEITWKDESDFEDGYIIYRGAVPIDSTGDNTTSYIDRNPPFNTRIQYRVAAFDAHGESVARADSGSITLLAPASFNASDVYNDRVELKWVDRSAVEDGYRVFRDGVLLATLVADQTAYTDATGLLGTTYGYSVEALRGTATSVRLNDSGNRHEPSVVVNGIGLTPIPASENNIGDQFGVSVAAADNFVIVGAPFSDVLASSAGSAVIYVRGAGGALTESARLTASDGAVGQRFGEEVAISGRRAVVRSRTGHYVFSLKPNGLWTEDTIIHPPGSSFSNTGYLAMSGSRFIVGMHTPPAVFVFELDSLTGIWTSKPLTPSAPVAAQAAAVAIHGNHAIVGDDVGHAAYIFRRQNNGNWTETAKLANGLDPSGDSFFGWSVAIDESLAVVGSDAQLNPHAFAFELDAGGLWGAPGPGGTRVQSALLPANSTDPNYLNNFGFSVAAGRNWALVGNPRVSAGVHSYVKTAESGWKLVDIFERPAQLDGVIGSQVALSGEFGLIGNLTAGAQTGSAYAVAVPRPPKGLTASDGSRLDRVELTWSDDSSIEDGFLVNRNGVTIATLGPNANFFSDLNAEAGQTYAYSVSAVSNQSRVISPSANDFGWRPPNGSISGRITTELGGGLPGVSVRLEPPPGRSLLLDGAGGHVSIPDDGTFDFAVNRGFSIETWFRYSGTDRAPRILSKMEATGDGPRPFDLSFQRATGRLSFIISDGSKAARVLTARDSLNDDRWHHVACVSDSVARTITVYVDGVPEGSASTAALGDVTNNAPVTLGGFGGDTWFGGQLDELRIWRTARTAQQIAAGWREPLGGDETELLGYWPFDEGSGTAITDFARNRAHYGAFEGGVYWSEDVAPVDASIRTDSEGAFVLSGIRYGTQSSFKLRPSFGTHQFSPPSQPVSLTTESPVWNSLAFADITSYTVTGHVRFAGTECPASGVEILVDSKLAGATDKNGKFSVAVSDGAHSIRARLEGHTLELAGDPAQADSLLLPDVTGDVAGIEFLDTTTRLVHGRVSGGCDRFVGDVTLRFRSENNCLVLLRTVTAADSGRFALDLPPQKYFVSATVANIPQSLVDQGLRPDIVQFFQTLGERELNLTTAPDSSALDFVYHAPLAVIITGFPPPACSQLTLEDGTALPDGLPVMSQLTAADLTISVHEVYGPGDTCPLDTGIIVISDEIFDRAGSPDTLVIGRDGTALYRTVATTPSLLRGRMEGLVDRSFQKAFTAVAHVEGRAPASRTEWVLVTGHVGMPGADFVTFKGNEQPQIILRDPPGDGSYAFLQRGYTSRRVTKFDENSFSVGGGLETQFVFGFNIQTFQGVGIGAFIGTIDELESSWTLKNDFSVRFESSTENRVTEFVRVEDRLATTSFGSAWGGNSGGVVGPASDIFVGTGTNYVFTEAGTIELSGCRVVQSTAVAFEPDSIRTTFAYTAGHIAEVLIPELESKRDLFESQGDDVQRQDYDAQVENWSNVLALNDSLKQGAKVLVNRSFSAGAELSFTTTLDTLRDHRKASRWVLEEKAKAGTDFVTKILGGKTKVVLDLTATYVTEFDSRLTDSTATSSRSVGYLLADDDIGDNFSVDVMNDGAYPTPAFRVRGGRSSCPYEPWPDSTGAATMAPRDAPHLLIDHGGSLVGVPADAPALFTLTLANNSSETRDYTVSLLSNSNPGGASVTINGSPADAGVSFTIDGVGQANVHEATLAVRRGPTRYNYPDLRLVVTPACGDDGLQNDELSLSVAFAGCSDVRLAAVGIGSEIRTDGGGISGWKYALADTGSVVDLVMDRYERNLGRPDSLHLLGAQYRRLGSGSEGPGPWRDIATVRPGVSEQFQNGDGSADTVITWQPDSLANGVYEPLPDGVYEVRAFTECAGGGRGYSAVATGTIDRHAPVAFGAPEPADGQLSLGEDIRLAFNEPVQCQSVVTDSVWLAYLDGPAAGQRIPVQVTCSEQGVVLATPDSLAHVLEGRRLRARVAGARDLAGNPMAAAIAWEFEFRKSQFAWSRSRVSRVVPLGEPDTLAAELANGTATVLDYALDGLPAWLSVRPSEAAGRIGPGATRTIHFEVDPSIPGGENEAQVRALALGAANDTIGVAVLDLFLDVACSAPTWVVDASRFEHSMSVVGKLVVDATSAPLNAAANRIAAFVGHELRGVAAPSAVAGDSLVFLTIFSNRTGGETVRFEVWNDLDCRRFPATAERMPFRADSVVGTAASPVVFHALTVPVTIGSFALSSGWTWFSTNVVSGDMSVASVLSSLSPAAGDLIKSKTAFATFDPTTPTGWVGSLGVIDNASGYMIRMSQPATLQQEGAPVDPVSTPVPLAAGWNWIGYTRSSASGVTSALVNLGTVGTGGFLAGGEVVRSQSAFAQYQAGAGWLGTGVLMEPGRSYRLFLQAGPLPGSFTYPDNSPPLVALTGFGLESVVSGAAAGAEGPGWSVADGRFARNMTVIAALQLEGGEALGVGSTVGAFVGDECRGFGRPMHVAGLERDLVFLTIHGDDTDVGALTFRVFDPRTSSVLDVAQTIPFQGDAALGTLREPLLIAARAATVRAPLAFRLGQNQPNPFRPQTALHFDLPRASHVELTIYDIRGRRVRTVVDRDYDAGAHSVVWDGLTSSRQPAPSGVYFYTLRAGSFSDTKKMVRIQ